MRKFNNAVILQERKKRAVDSDQIYLADVMAYQVCCLLFAQCSTSLSAPCDFSFRANLKKLQNCTASLAKHPRYIHIHLPVVPLIQCTFVSVLTDLYCAGCWHVHWFEEIWASQGVPFACISGLVHIPTTAVNCTHYRSLWELKVLVKQLVIWWRNKQSGVKQARTLNLHGMHYDGWWWKCTDTYMFKPVLSLLLHCISC